MAALPASAPPASAPSASAPPTSPPSWTPRQVRSLVDARAGGGGVWEYSGTLTALGTGRVLAHLAGVEEVVIETPFRAQAPSKDGVVQSLTTPPAGVSATSAAALTKAASAAAAMTHSASLLVRTTLFYTQVTAPHARMKEYRFRPTTPRRSVEPILGAASRVEIGVDGRGALTMRQRRSGSGEEGATMRVEEAPGSAGGMLVAGWGYVGRPRAGLAKGATAPGVVERYDVVVGDGGGVRVWNRVGRCPAWYGRGLCMTAVRARRVGWEGLDDKVRAWMAEVGRGRFAGDFDEEGPAVAVEEVGRRRKLFGLF